MVSFNSALSLVLLAGTASISSAFTAHPQHGLAAPAYSGTSLYMGWGPDPIWTASDIEGMQIGNMSKESSKVTVNVSPETAADFKVPGQYVQVRPNEDTKPLFLAISSPPDAENATFEFLIKKTDDNTWISDRESLASGI